jgi:hypothetical protein
LETLVNVSPPKPGGGNSRKRGSQASQSNHTKPGPAKPYQTMQNHILPSYAKNIKLPVNVRLSYNKYNISVADPRHVDAPPVRLRKEKIKHIRLLFRLLSLGLHSAKFKKIHIFNAVPAPAKK